VKKRYVERPRFCLFLSREQKAYVREEHLINLPKILPKIKIYCKERAGPLLPALLPPSGRQVAEIKLI